MTYHTTKKPMKKTTTKKTTTKKTTMKTNKLSEKQMKQLETHSKKHKGGMQSSHIKSMMKFMKQGDNFIVAHNKTKKLEKK